MIDIFIPSYKRAGNIKTAYYFLNLGYDAKKIHVIIDDETPDIDDYKKECIFLGVNLNIFSLKENQKKFEFITLPTKSKRAAGLSRNSFYDYAKEKKIEFFVVIDDDVKHYEIKNKGRYVRPAKLNDILYFFSSVKKFMYKRRVGLFGLPQTGDYYGGVNDKLFVKKVMNMTFVYTKFIYRGERGAQDDDTSQFTSVLNFGHFTGTLNQVLYLNQMPSATQRGGLTELYKEAKLLHKSLITVIQFPSAIVANKQKKNGNRLHHKITYKFLCPMIIRSINGRDNIAWDTYEEDGVFTNEKIIQYER